MKLIWCILALTQAFAGEAPLSFSARIQDEALAEEAIDLLHCVAERKGISWELGSDNAPAPSVRLVEKGGRLEGIFRDEATREFTLSKNGWRAACDELVPEAARASAASPYLPTEAPETEKSGTGESKGKWLVAGAVVAALAGGFILWRAGRPDHRSLRME